MSIIADIDDPKKSKQTKINAKTSDLNPSVMCTSKSEKGYSLCFLFVQKQNQSHSQALKLVIARSCFLLQ